MRLHWAVISLFLLSCSNNASDWRNGHTKTDTLKRSSLIDGNIKRNVASDTHSTKVDTIAEFVKENLYDGSLINLSFCQKEIIKLLNKNDSCKKIWRSKIKHLFTMYDDPVDYVDIGMEIKFFKDRLNEQSELQNEFPDGYGFLVNSLPIAPDTSFPINKYQKLILRFGHADGANFSELSGVYYSFLITNGLRFINAIEQNPKCIMLFRKWVNNIEETEFVAYGGDDVPPQIIERKRNYLIDKYSSIKDSLMKEIVFKIRIAKIRSID